jgi:hypothetical protein
MFRSSTQMFLVLIALAAVLACAGSVSAAIVATHTGPTTFDGSSTRVDLPNVSIGLEGTVSLEFKADDTADLHTLWYCADSQGGTSGEYRLRLQSNEFSYQLWPSSGENTVNDTISFAFTDTTSWHSTTLSWKNGEHLLFTLDGVTKVINQTGLAAFTSTTGNHVLGVNTVNGGIRYFDGEMRNVVISDAYSPLPTPEPGTLMLLATGLFGLLAYAWRRRR